MNYRHHYHAGNYADVFKHALLLVLVRAMQRKEKGFLYLDTHAGRGGYDLTVPSVLPDGREREPEWPEGIGRFAGAAGLPAALAEYLALIQRFNDRCGAEIGSLQYYPGSPWFVQMLARAQDRLVLCELREDDADALAADFRQQAGVVVRLTDGYNALKAMLPPVERRALVLIDPPFESKDEFADIVTGLREALRRFPTGVYAVWYPITERARVEAYHEAVRDLGVPVLAAELQVAGESAAVRMKGCGLLVLNPPWQIEREMAALLPVLVERLRADAGAKAGCTWVVPER